MDVTYASEHAMKCHQQGSFKPELTKLHSIVKIKHGFKSHAQIT